MSAILFIGGWLLIAFSSSFQLRTGPLSATYGRLTFMLAEFLFVISLGFSLHEQHPEWLGLPLFIAPGAGLAFALLIFGTYNDGGRKKISPVRSANLATRTAGSYIPQKSRRKLMIMAAAIMILVLIGGLTSSKDSSGAYRAFSVHSAGLDAASAPYPGWFYGVPVLLTLPLIALGAWASLRRVRLLPAIVTDTTADARWRVSLSEVLLSAVEIALLCNAAALVFGFATAFSALGSVSSEPVPLYIVQAILRVAGISLGIWAVVLFIRSALRTIQFKKIVAVQHFSAPIPASRER
ncbi:hypothetical protein [Arthrobacter sp. NPDC090010]|uniref:hypothetical protein n=1 Tax=Arthrobacter sp. NPDC090010 TaxID=3363942 RepID=UPI00381C9803